MKSAYTRKSEKSTVLHLGFRRIRAEMRDEKFDAWSFVLAYCDLSLLRIRDRTFCMRSTVMEET